MTETKLASFLRPGAFASRPDPIGFPAPGLRASQTDVPGLPARPVERRLSLRQQRERYMALSEEAKAEQMRLHIEALRTNSDQRPEFSDLLYAMGVTGD